MADPIKPADRSNQIVRAAKEVEATAKRLSRAVRPTDTAKAKAKERLTKAIAALTKTHDATKVAG